jgi:hypothetical protein
MLPPEQFDDERQSSRQARFTLSSSGCMRYGKAAEVAN